MCKFVTGQIQWIEHSHAYKNFGTLLENNTADSYSTVLGETVSAAERLHVRIQHLQTVISDFELAIISAVKNEFSIESVRLCFFHLCQSIYRIIQSEGLQQQYMDPNDDSIRKAAHSMWNLFSIIKCIRNLPIYTYNYKNQ